MISEYLDLLSCKNTPNYNAFIVRSRSQKLAIKRKGYSPNIIGVEMELKLYLVSFEIPHVGELISGSSGDELAIGGKDYL